MTVLRTTFNANARLLVSWVTVTLSPGARTALNLTGLVVVKRPIGRIDLMKTLAQTRTEFSRS